MSDSHSYAVRNFSSLLLLSAFSYYLSHYDLFRLVCEFIIREVVRTSTAFFSRSSIISRLSFSRTLTGTISIKSKSFEYPATAIRSFVFKKIHLCIQHKYHLSLARLEAFTSSRLLRYFLCAVSHKYNKVNPATDSFTALICSESLFLFLVHTRCVHENELCFSLCENTCYLCSCCSRLVAHCGWSFRPQAFSNEDLPGCLHVQQW